MSQTLPYSYEVETAVIARMLREPKSIPTVLASYVGRDDFYMADTRLLFDRLAEAHAGSDAIDVIVIGERARGALAEIWGVDPAEASHSLKALVADAPTSGNLPEHVVALKRLSASRRLVGAAEGALRDLGQGERSPAEIGSELVEIVTDVTTGGRDRSLILSDYDKGNRFLRELVRQKRMRERGIEYGVFTGLRFFDIRAAGLLPGEVFMLAGEPGVGKSAISQALARGFARRQLGKDVSKRVGTFQINIEMAEHVDTMRTVQSLTGLSSSRLRRGDVSDQDIRSIAKAYVADQAPQLPLYSNHASHLFASQLRALVFDAIDRFNVGFVIIDHFRMWDLDRNLAPYHAGANEMDEAKARFLKQLAKELDIAILCLAHTVKMRREGSDGRPTLSDLRGSYQVAAFCDVVCFVYQPYMYASPEEIENGVAPPETDAELIFAKNRNNRKGTAEFYMDGETMTVRDKW